jgi:hypothetical protein
MFLASSGNELGAVPVVTLLENCNVEDDGVEVQNLSSEGIREDLKKEKGKNNDLRMQK